MGPSLPNGSTLSVLLIAGLVEKLRVHIMPVFLGSGRRLFDHPDLVGVELERTRLLEVGQRTSMSFRVRP
jgi:dihydrofolate reductase